MELRDLDATLRRLAAGEPGDVDGTLRALRDGVDAALAVPVVLRLLALSCHRVERSCQRLPISVIARWLASGGVVSDRTSS